MRMNRRLRAMLCGLLMQAGVLFGVPVRPQDVEQLMHAMHQQKGGQMNPDSPEPGGPPEGAS
jgi:hypothetical protein